MGFGRRPSALPGTGRPPEGTASMLSGGKYHCTAMSLWENLKGLMCVDGDGVGEIPEWFVRGRTVLIPKPDCQGRPDQYWPIMCLNTTYKLFTAVITILLRRHVAGNSILPPEQKALVRQHRRCLDALWVDSTVKEEAKRQQRDLSVAWVDYRKAYDSVPHDWLRVMLAAIKAPEQLQRCIDTIMPGLKSEFRCGVGRDAVKADLTFRRGLFQGDSLSPLLFCLSIAPLSRVLRGMHAGFTSKYFSRLTHLLFMDDLKVYADGPENLKKMLTLVDRVSEAVGMQLGLNKCAVAHLRKGKPVLLGEVVPPGGKVVPALKDGDETPTGI